MNRQPLPLSQNRDLEPEFEWPAVASDVALPRVEFDPHCAVVTAECYTSLCQLCADVGSNAELQSVKKAAERLIHQRERYKNRFSTKEMANKIERQSRKRRRLTANYNNLAHTVSTVGPVVEEMHLNSIPYTDFIVILERKLDNSAVFDRQQPLTPVPYAGIYDKPTAEEAAELGTCDSIMGLSDERLEYFAQRYNCLIAGETPSLRKTRILTALGVRFYEIQERRESRAVENNSAVFDRQQPLTPVPYAGIYDKPTAEEAAELGTCDSIMGLSDERLEYFAQRYNCLIAGETPSLRKTRILTALGVRFYEIQERRESRAVENNSAVFDRQQPLTPVPYAGIYDEPTAEEAAELGTCDSIMGLNDERLEYFAQRYDCLVAGESPSLQKTRILTALGVRFYEIQTRRESRARENNSYVPYLRTSLTPVPYATMYDEPTAEEAAELGTCESIMGLSDERLDYFAQRYDCLVAGDSTTVRRRRLFVALGLRHEIVTDYLSQQSRALNWKVDLRRDQSLSPVANLEGEFPQDNLQINLASTAAVDMLGVDDLNDILDFYSVRTLKRTKRPNESPSTSAWVVMWDLPDSATWLYTYCLPNALFGPNDESRFFVWSVVRYLSRNPNSVLKHVSRRLADYRPGGFCVLSLISSDFKTLKVHKVAYIEVPDVRVPLCP